MSDQSLADRSPVAPGGRYSPGPWRVEGRFVNALKAKTVAELPMGGVRHGKVDAANALLIAAAPAMFEALMILLRFCELHEREAIVLQAPSWFVAMTPNPIEQARAALAAARPPTESDEP